MGIKGNFGGEGGESDRAPMASYAMPFLAVVEIAKFGFCLHCRIHFENRLINRFYHFNPLGAPRALATGMTGLRIRGKISSDAIVNCDLVRVQNGIGLQVG